jgi:hypothetical protein
MIDGHVKLLVSDLNLKDITMLITWDKQHNMRALITNLVMDKVMLIVVKLCILVEIKSYWFYEYIDGCVIFTGIRP